MADGGVRVFVPCAVAAILCAIPAQAQEAQETLAREIEATSKTVYLLEPSTFFRTSFGFRRALVVDECDITAETHETGPNGETTYGLTFDLHRTRVPDPDEPENPFFAVHDLDETEDEDRIGIIRFAFVPPHAPRFHGQLPEGWSDEPVAQMNFWMEPLADGQDPRRLLALLLRYQAEYCTLAG